MSYKTERRELLIVKCGCRCNSLYTRSLGSTSKFEFLECNVNVKCTKETCKYVLEEVEKVVEEAAFGWKKFMRETLQLDFPFDKYPREHSLIDQYIDETDEHCDSFVIDQQLEDLETLRCDFRYYVDNTKEDEDAHE